MQGEQPDPLKQGGVENQTGKLGARKRRPKRRAFGRDDRRDNRQQGTGQGRGVSHRAAARLAALPAHRFTGGPLRGAHRTCRRKAQRHPPGPRHGQNQGESRAGAQEDPHALSVPEGSSRCLDRILPPMAN